MERGARVVVAERWAILRRGLVGLIHGSHTVVSQLEDVRQLPGMLSTADRLDLAVVGDGVGVGVDLSAVVAATRVQSPATHVMVLCDQIDRTGLQDLLRAGAAAVVSKKIDDQRLLDDIGRVLRGDRVIDQLFLPLLFGSDVLDDRITEESLLTAREREVLSHLARGASNREIADSLLVGESTVKSHLARIYAKLGVDGRYRAVGRAVELGLLT